MPGRRRVIFSWLETLVDIVDDGFSWGPSDPEPERATVKATVIAWRVWSAAFLILAAAFVWW
jgi:hypothetical protein